MKRGPLERRVENVDEESQAMVNKRKREDDETIITGGEDEEKRGEEPPVSKQRRVSILPGTLAYNEAIMASFDAIELDEVGDRDVDSVLSSPSPSSPSPTSSPTSSQNYIVDEPPDDSEEDDSTSPNVQEAVD